MLMYADDTTLFCNINNDINDNEINRQLNTISEWLLSNKLSLNIKNLLWEKFHSLGIRGPMLRAVKSLYQSVQCSVRVNGIDSEW